MNRKLKFRDIIWGDIEINEPVVAELINSIPFQRLKGIDQAGYLPLYANPKNLDRHLLKHNRFEHSIGVYWLLKEYSDSLEAQISGLLHDISHTAFSHTADYVFDEGCPKNHDYQDKIHENFIKNSAINDILEKYGFDVDKISCESNFPLLENNIPDICADRIDYSLRTALHFRDYSSEEVEDILNHLKSKNSKWYFDNMKYAQLYATLFKKMNDEYYSNFSTAVMFFSLSKLFKHAIDKKYINKEDFINGDDEYILNKIRKYLDRDEKLTDLYFNINHQEVFRLAKEREGLESIYCKSRIVNPLVLKEGNLVRLSELDREWVRIVKEDLKPKEYYLKIVK